MKIVNKASRIRLCLWRLTLLCGLPICGANAAQYLDFAYQSANGAVTITGYTGSGGSVTIPSSVQGMPVRYIGDSAFHSVTTLTKVTIPDSVTSLGNFCFMWCVKLESAILPSSLTSLGDLCFEGCTVLANVTIPNGVTYISRSAFAYTGLTSISIPNSVTRIGETAFDGCLGLTKVTIPESVTSLGAGCFWDCANLENVRIPDSVTSIGDVCFSGCTKLAAITIPDGVLSIRSRTFSYSGLTNISIPNSITYIGDDVFEGCSGLTNVTIPESVTWLGNCCFLLCGNLENVTIPNSVTSIGDYCLGGCVKLTAVTIPDGVTSLGHDAFLECSNLTTVTIGKGIRFIGDNAFYSCPSLTTVLFEGNAPKFGGPNVFGNNNRAVVYYRGGTAGWGPTFAGRPTQMLSSPPFIENPLDLGVVLEGATVNLMAQIAGSPAPSFQWFFNGEPVVGATNVVFIISSASALNVGAYQVIANNVLGSVTNGPATLGVNNVKVSNFVGLVMTDVSGAPLQIQSAAQIRGPWTPLAELTLTNNPGVLIDFDATHATQRFYRTTASGGLSVWMFPGWNYAAPVGSQHKIEFVNAQVGFTNWQFLTNLTVPSSPYLFIDTSATEKSERFYRTTPLP
jgi:hypothetical protein